MGAGNCGRHGVGGRGLRLLLRPGLPQPQVHIDVTLCSPLFGLTLFLGVRI